MSFLRIYTCVLYLSSHFNNSGLLLFLTDVQTSNLVLTAETRTAVGKEPDGSAQTLQGRMVGRMGDKVARSRPTTDGMDQNRSTKRSNETSTEKATRAKRRRSALGMSVLEIETASFYKPRTKESREAYESILSVIHGQFEDVPQDVLRSAADEVLAIVKNDRLKDPERHREINKLLGKISDDTFAQLIALGKLIHDFVPEGEADGADAAEREGALDEELGVAVEFEDEDEEEEDEEGLAEEIIDEAVEEDEEEEEKGDEGEGWQENGKGAAENAVRATTVEDEEGEGELAESLVPVQEIDAYWLQRKIHNTYGDSLEATKAQELAEAAFAILQLPDTREVENKLVTLLDFDRFQLIKDLIRNKTRIVLCMTLARTETDEARLQIENEMMQSPEGVAVLDALRGVRASVRDRRSAVERSIREEARRLRRESASEEVRDATNPAYRGSTAAPGRHMLDLDALAFSQGAHFNSAKQTAAPPGSYRIVQKGYEEVHVPALKAPPFREDERLIHIGDLPSWTRPGFSGMKSLNRIQSRVCETALFSSENMLVCAPTGAGKTNVAMLTMLHEIGLHRREAEDGVAFDVSSFKMIYVAPMKALVAEMVGNFSRRLEPFGIKVKELTGDVSLTRSEIEDTQLIIVTPEKWDIITRKSPDRAFTQLVRLVIIDEIHLLHDERGPVLECLVARTLRQVEASTEMVRLVGLSATLPNYEDVAQFLRVDPKKGLFYFDNSYRPCPLAQQYIGVSTKRPLQRFQLMNEICYTKVIEAAGKHQVLVFVHSRKDTAKTAKFLKEEAMKNDDLARLMRDDSASREILQTEAESCKSQDLREILPFGFGIHHAGMTRADRTLVEDLFADGHIQVLVSTATLAWGVNLPAHTVIIKGTQIYNPVKAAWTELSPLDVMQMFGRAGRPQFDSFGEGIIITTSPQLPFYLSLFNMQLPVESQMISKLADNLNAEIVLGGVQSIKDSATWLGYTYLYCRMVVSPQLYGIPIDEVEKDPSIMERRLDLAHSAAVSLDRHGLVRYDRRSGALQPTDLGRVASHYYVTHGTIAAFAEVLRPTMGEIELLRLFSRAEEFKYMVVREEEKLELAKLIDRVPIPVKEALDDPMAKVNVLLQAYISRLKLEGLALSADMVYVTQSAGRLMRCLFEVCLRRGWANLTDRALTLSKCVQRRMWSSQTPLRQFKGLPDEILVRVERKELPWERWYDLSSQELGELVRVPKAGKTLHRLIHQFPLLELAASVQPVTRTLIKVDLTLTPDFQWDENVHGRVQHFLILVEDADSEVLLHHEPLTVRASQAEEDIFVSFTLPISEPVPPQYFVRVISDQWLGSEATLPISFRHLLLPERYPPPTELLDLQPLPIDVLRSPQLESVFSSRFHHFNPIQTQAFNALYSSDQSMLLAAPAGSGKTVAAELAILRMLQRGADRSMPTRAVYVAPFDAVADERFSEWSKRFGEGLGLTVVRLNGEPQTDLKLLDRATIAISTPTAWDVLSRRWKQRKVVQGVSLFIIDDLHLIGGPVGPTIEVVCSRMRQMSATIGTGLRILALASSLANGRDLGEWLGASSHGIFNFAPAARPTPIDIHIQGFESGSLELRQEAMARPVYQSILRHGSVGDPAIVFAPTRRHARQAAADLLTFAAADGEPQKFLQASEEDLMPIVARIKEPALKHALSFGVAILHDGQDPEEQSLACKLFDSGAVQILVAASSMVWRISSVARLVVIMGTQSYDVTGQGTSDIAMSDVLQMVGRAGRPAVDARGTCVLMCHAPRKEFYKRFLHEPLPVESHLDASLHDALIAEIVAGTVRSTQAAVDYLTWTLYYRRLTLNPNYYNMTGVSHRHVSEHLSELVEGTISDLAQAKMIETEEELDAEGIPIGVSLSPLNLGMIAAYYNVSYTTIELFSASLGAKTKLKGLLETLCAATEFDDVPVRPGEESLVRRILAHAKVAVEKPRYTDPHTKVNALLQAHLSRERLNADLSADARRIVRSVPRLLQALVDVVASSGWLNPALAAMELSQMVTQAMWQRDPVLMQVPGVPREVAERASAAGMETVFDVMELSDRERRAALGIVGQEHDDEAASIAEWMARYPDIGVSYEIEEAESVLSGEPVSLIVSMEREGDGDVGPVSAPRFPGRRDEGWWIVVGDPSSNQLLAIKRLTLQRASKTRLEFLAPEQAGSLALTLFLTCDSYLGCDQEFEISLQVKAAPDTTMEES